MRYIPRVSLYEGSLNRGSSVKHATVSAWRWGWVKEKIDARSGHPPFVLARLSNSPKKERKE